MSEDERNGATDDLLRAAPGVGGIAAPGVWAMAFLAWAGLCAALSHAPIAWTGTFFSMTGFTLVAGMVAFYSIGRVVPDDPAPVAR